MSSDIKYPEYIQLYGYVSKLTDKHTPDGALYKDLYHFMKGINKWMPATACSELTRVIFNSDALKNGTHMTSEDLAKFVLINGLF